MTPDPKTRQNINSPSRLPHKMTIQEPTPATFPPGLGRHPESLTTDTAPQTDIGQLFFMSRHATSTADRELVRLKLEKQRPERDKAGGGRQ